MTTLFLAALLLASGAVDSTVIVGAVRDAASRQPVAGARLELVELELTTRTDRQGRFRMADVPGGRWTLSVTAAGYRADTLTVLSPGTDTLRLDVELAPLPRAERQPANLLGQVRSADTGQPIAGAAVRVEGIRRIAVTDSAGRYVLPGIPPGRWMLRAERIGFAATRVPVLVQRTGSIVQHIELAESALQVAGITVVADAASRAEGELGTASIIAEEAIRTQVAASLAGVLELVPGMPLQPPGLDGVQQVALRAVQTPGLLSEDLASLGTLIILDGVPLSNNANLQTTGPRGEINAGGSAGGGIDLRRIPASTLQRVEVIRGVPSARYGDLTQGAIIVETKAGEVPPESSARLDPRTTEGSILGGTRINGDQTATLTFDAAHTRLSPGVSDDDAFRLAAQLSHRARLGSVPASVQAQDARLVLDTRVDVFQLHQDNPEEPDVAPGRASRARDAGVRVFQRAYLALGDAARLNFTGALDYKRQRSFVQRPAVRAAMPFTDRLTEGRQEGHFIGGSYRARVDLDGDPWMLYSRIEAELSRERLLGFRHEVRPGLELRREWNAGPGYQFDIEFPPQSRFNGVQGFDRPRRFDEVPPLTTSALYLDDRLSRSLWGDALLNVQAGVRLDLLHEGGTWISGVRDAVLQPRLTIQLSPFSPLRLMASAGRTAKLPTLGQLSPAPQYYDVVNVNYFANDPAERLAVLTTFIRDPTNSELGLARALKREVGMEVDLGRSAALSLVGFRDRVDGAVGIGPEPGFLLREHFELTDSVLGNGVRPEIIEPAARADTVPILIDRPANNLGLESEGLELTATLPEVRPLRTRLQLQGAWIRTWQTRDGLDFGPYFSDFQIDERDARTPYWETPTAFGERALLTWRLIHHQPGLGLVLTTTVQHTLKQLRRQIGSADTLAFAGYMTRAGELVPVPPERRGDAEFADIRQARGTLTRPLPAPHDWFLSLQVSKTLPLDGRLSFYAFNAMDRQGRFPGPGQGSLVFPSMRFGLEVSVPAGALGELW